MPLLPSLAGLTAGEISLLLTPLPRFRAAQITDWIKKGAASFHDMKNLPAALRGELAGRFSVFGSTVTSALSDSDGTVKLQVALEDGLKIEAVLLVDAAGRKTACLSTQAGCAMACAFCKTGSLPFRRNLKAGEIIEQFLHLRHAAGELLSNIVIMGMGEPLLNLDELAKALRFFTAAEGLGISPRRITVSTSGIVRGIRAFAGEHLHTRLAFSLATADESLRARLMPVTKQNPLAEVKAALQYYQQQEKHRITLELVLLGGVNTRAEDAAALAVFADGLDTAVNLIPWNPVSGMCLDGSPLREPRTAEILRFREELEKRGIAVTRRRRRGRGVSGACGQLGVTE